MSKVITVTLNPSMDKTLVVDNYTTGKVNRARSIRYDVAGKGINVSKVLINFGIESTCVGFLGGLWESNFKEELDRRKIKHSFTHIEGEIRTNTKIVDEVNNSFTDLNEKGPEIENSSLEQFIINLERMCEVGDIVVLSGGINPGLPVDIYSLLVNIAKGKGAIVILDAAGPFLEAGIQSIPHILKPNNHELATLKNINEDNDEEIVKAAQKLNCDGIDKILVSLGEKGAYYITKNGVYYANGLKAGVKSTVGAGDSMVAALVYSLLNNFDEKNTLKFAIACATATVKLEGTQPCTLEEVNALIDKVEIKII